MGNKIEQEAGNNSTNIQVAGNVTIGIRYNEVKEIALDVFNNNFFKLSKKAANKALTRAEELVNDFLNNLYEKNRDVIEKLQEPAMQYSLYNALKGYAKTGDVKLKEQLMELLLQRISSEERSLTQIVLDEAIEVLPKLTREQINMLTLLFSVIFIIPIHITSLSGLNDHFNNQIMQFYSPVSSSYSFLTHLQFSGCCTVISEGSAWKPLAEIYKTMHSGLFSKGFTQEEFDEQFRENANKLKPLLITCLHDSTKLQINALNNSILKQLTMRYKVSDFENLLRDFQNKYLMNNNEIEQYFINQNPLSKKLFEEWKSNYLIRSSLKTTLLTSVGFAIAIMNYNQQTNSNFRIEQFI